MHQIVDDFFLNYRTTPHSSTGRTPAELMLKLQPRTRLSLLKPDPIGTTRVTTAEKLVERKFHTRDTVLLGNFLGGPKWISASVHKQIGLIRYIMETINGKLREAHVDHLMKAWAGLTLDKFVIPKDTMPTWRPTQPALPPPPAHSTYLMPSWDPLLPPPQPPATPTLATIQDSPVEEVVPSATPDQISTSPDRITSPSSSPNRSRGPMVDHAPDGCVVTHSGRIVKTPNCFNWWICDVFDIHIKWS